MECCLRKTAKRSGDIRSRDLTRVGQRFTPDKFRERGCRSERSDAALAFETDVGDAAVFDARGEAEDVAANRIGDIDGCCGVGKVASIARVLKMVEDDGGVHRPKYGKAEAVIQMRRPRKGEMLRSLRSLPSTALGAGRMTMLIA